MCLCTSPLSHSLFQCSQQLEPGWREQGAGVLHASLYWRGNDAPCPTQVLSTRYFVLSIHTYVFIGIKSLVVHTKIWYYNLDFDFYVQDIF